MAAHAALRTVLALRAATDGPASDGWRRDTSDWHFATLPGQLSMTIHPAGDSGYAYIISGPQPGPDQR